mgnify:CR=1 FL=1
METIRFKNDSRTRQRLMVPESFQHPAKGHLGMWTLMIERYSKPGDWVLDPMAGSGSTLLAALMGRNVICVELEQHFVEPMRRSWEKMRNIPMLGYEMGQVAIFQGDARDLSWLESASAIITSPPWEDKTALRDSKWLHEHEAELAEQFRQAHAGESGVPGNTKPENRSTMEGYTRPSAIITSPPYEGFTEPNDEQRTHSPGGIPKYRFSQRRGYTRPDAIITSPPYEGVADASKNTNTNDGLRGHPETQGKPMRYTRKVAAVVTSPPFEQAQSGGGIAIKGHTNDPGLAQRAYSAKAMSATSENIGNLRSDAYFSAMCRVYSECYRILRPGGILALVLKGFTRDGQYVDLPGQTEAMLLEAGWVKHDHWRRQLWSLSFWRILQKRRDPAAFDDRLMYEEVLAFRKSVV